MTKELLERLGVTQTELCLAIGMDAALMSRKLSGQRRWYLHEAKAIAGYLSERQGLPFTVDQLFTLPQGDTHEPNRVA